ncbi:MAG: hypothetical protein AB7E28_03215 [Desulfurella sp.]
MLRLDEKYGFQGYIIFNHFVVHPKLVAIVLVLKGITMYYLYQNSNFYIFAFYLKYETLTHKLETHIFQKPYSEAIVGNTQTVATALLFV